MDRLRGDRASRLNFWIVPAIFFALAILLPLLGGLTGDAGLLRLSRPMLTIGIVWLLALGAWGLAQERRVRLAQAAFPDDVVEPALRARRSIRALWMLRSAGADVAERAPRRWLLVVTSDALEIWGGPLRRLVRYARIPFASVVGVEIDRVLDRRQFRARARGRCGATRGGAWQVPLIVLGGSPYGVGTTGVERLAEVREAVDVLRAERRALNDDVV